MPAIIPSLWFNQNIEAAMKLYTETFPDSSIDNIMYVGEDGPGPAGSILAATFTLSGHTFEGINAGPEFTFSEAVSFAVRCSSQEEVDYYWNALTANGGIESECGWLKDPFGLSWQIVPERLYELLSDPNPARVRGATDAMMKTHGKLIIADLEAGADSAG
ncbi:VOC family protein [Nocardia sp. 348MFTsu5.1]|uniref:VOC family protein n=1 Tax=Nocardia sp. 348MFTsu5.1 TaxID=1172185 RepID=UPI0004903A80|nr:VOC family protein [Nocardia sp. 348MFTsu5.1]